MRKLFVFLVAAVFMSAASSAAFAQFSSVSSVKKTAKVVFTQAGTFTWDIAIKNVSDDAEATDITWDASAITPGSTAWANALQYVLITSTVTQVGAGIQVYTDNVNSSGTYKYYPQDTEAISAGGLVGVQTSSATPLPMAWRMKDSKQASGFTVDPTSSIDEIRYSSLYFKDKSNNINNPPEATPFVNGEDYVTILKGGSGWRWGGGPSDIGGSASGSFYMYIGANFSSASTPNEYGTDTLTFEGYTE